MLPTLLIGIVCGMLVVIMAMVLLMPMMGKLFFVADRSKRSFEDTVNEIRNRCEQDKNWVIQGEKDYNQAYLSNKRGELPHRLVEFKLGNPDHSYQVNATFPEVCTFMPAAIAIVEYKPDKVIIYRKNTALMGRMFKEPVRSIMSSEVPEQLDTLLDGLI
ncbi:MAG: hypothetical protein EOL87_16080 [Spartobacteria bacterium]|nr:hypothetical protein [Spartobacteria bacterium]